MLGIVMRVMASIPVIWTWGLLNFGFSTAATIISGQAAGGQFENSDIAYATATALTRAINMPMPIINLGFTAILLVIWWVPMRRFSKYLASLLVVLGALLWSPNAQAYYNQSDLAEVYFIMPNESAFWIPDVGANKDTQKNFGSEDYYKENKIAAKRFQVPHALLPKSTGWFQYDMYVPTGRLIIVDRTPVSREWVDSHDRGTANTKQGFPCQSSEGLDITVGVTLGASVTEENAPRFLYRFGVITPSGQRSDPNVTFASVYTGRSLATVTDGPVRNKIQALVCGNISAHTLDENNKQAGTVIMPAIEKDVTEYLAKMGITLDYIGWADTFSFGSKVQDAIDRRYVADKDAEIAKEMSPHIATLQGLAAAKATESIANKWNGQVPQQVSLWWLPDSLTNFFNSAFSAKK